MDAPSPPSTVAAALRRDLERGLRSGLGTFWMLARTMVPAYLVALVLGELGVIEWLSDRVAPVMGMVGLPGEASLPLMLGYVLNVNAAIGSMQALSLTHQEVTVLALACLIGHNLIVEGAVVRKTGMNPFAFGALRIVSGLACAAVANQLMDLLPYADEPIATAAAQVGDEGLLRTFLVGSLDLLLTMFVIVVPIMIVLELFEGSRPFRALVRGWARLVRRLGMAAQTAIPTLVGFIFGLAYGGGVIVRETKRHELERRQVFLMDVFLSQIHAVFEDTLYFFAVGASIAWVVGFRLVWAVAVTALLGAVAGAVVRRRRGTAVAAAGAAATGSAAGAREITADDLLAEGVLDEVDHRSAVPGPAEAGQEVTGCERADDTAAGHS